VNHHVGTRAKYSYVGCWLPNMPKFKKGRAPIGGVRGGLSPVLTGLGKPAQHLRSQTGPMSLPAG